MSDEQEWRKGVLGRFECVTCGSELRLEQSTNHHQLRIVGQCGRLEPCAAKELEREAKAVVQELNDAPLSWGDSPEFKWPHPDRPVSLRLDVVRPEAEASPPKEKP